MMYLSIYNIIIKINYIQLYQTLLLQLNTKPLLSEALSNSCSKDPAPLQGSDLSLRFLTIIEDFSPYNRLVCNSNAFYSFDMKRYFRYRWIMADFVILIARHGAWLEDEYNSLLAKDIIIRRKTKHPIRLRRPLIDTIRHLVNLVVHQRKNTRLDNGINKIF